MTESKRRAGGSSGAAAAQQDADGDRAAKRRKLQEEFGDLSKGESPESTTAYGLSILDSIRATTDKSGRHIAPYFERLPSRSEDPGYYKKIRLPLSLESIERKLNNREYRKLSVLEGDLKRLVSNAKEINSRTSEVFSDAERVRKAVSNLMVKHNPAYKSGNYQAVATPFPDDDAEVDADGEDDGADAAAGGMDVDEEPEEEDEEEEQDDEDDDEDTEPMPAARRRSGRPPRRTSAGVPKSSRRSSPSQVKAEDASDGDSFEGLTFQQAQEKIVQSLIYQKDESGEYAYFEPFLNLPPRALKDYYEIIAEPLSLKALMKQVRGQHGRNEPTGVSTFKGWAALEDQAGLIWKNAYHYNEDGSEIYAMAQELEDQFRSLLEDAKQHVQEPPQQPKIKLKVPQAPEAPAVSGSKKITIHVGGKGSAAASPAPGTSQLGEGEITRTDAPLARTASGVSLPGSVNNQQLDKARIASALGVALSPSPSAAGAVKPEDSARQSPAVNVNPVANGVTHTQFAPIVQQPRQNGVHSPMGPRPPPVYKPTPMELMEENTARPHPIDEHEALMPNIAINSHPSLQLNAAGDGIGINVPFDSLWTHKEIIFQTPSEYFRLQIHPKVAPFLRQQEREWKLNVMHDWTRLYPTPTSDGSLLFDVTLRYGANRLEITLVAALPKGEKSHLGLDMEMERYMLHFNLLKRQ